MFLFQYLRPEDQLSGYKQLWRLDRLWVLRQEVSFIFICSLRVDLHFKFLYLNVRLVVSGMGQLLVWEWQSESYVFKQQGHFNNMASLAYSPDGQYIVTGGDDGKVSEGGVVL